MDLPIKYLYITMSDDQHGIVTSVVTIYAEGASAGEPLLGQLRREFAITADYDALWRFSIDDEGYEHWLPPVTKSTSAAVSNGVVDDDGGDAGNGNPPPPPPKNGG